MTLITSVDNYSLMPRKLRAEYAGAMYLCDESTNRCNPIFNGDNDRNQHCFLETLGELCAKPLWQIRACDKPAVTDGSNSNLVS
jgi:hypothetical protein